VIFSVIASWLRVSRLGHLLPDDWRIFGVIVQRIYAQMSNWVLVALPMFIFMGLMLERSGVPRS
jgi:TRAP-type mannitol/chloroaromatic compound transport system permease large subunit